MGEPLLILLHESDSVLVCVSPVDAGDPLLIDGSTIPAPEAVGVGHKIARSRLQPGQKVVKHGAPIGSVTSAVPAGGWIHSHNMKSDYIASHTRNTLSPKR